MINKADFNKTILKPEYSRRFPDPINNHPKYDELNIEHHILLCRAVNIPSGIPKDPNPRVQKIDYSIYKDVRDSLRNPEEPSFHLKNKGLTLLAHKVEYSDDKKVCTVYFSKNHGIADGAHTYEIILKALIESECPKDQYVKIEIITGVPANMAVEITGGLNTAVQVQAASLLNLVNRFQWIKDEFKGKRYEKLISYMQNEEGEFDIRDILAILTLFNTTLFSNGRQPKEAYTSKSSCLSFYDENQESYEKLKPILNDILFLHDYIHLVSGDRYNKEKGGKAGKTAILRIRKRGKFDFIFANKQSDSKMYDSIVLPILGAMRYLVEIKPGEKEYSWKFSTFDEVLKFYDTIAADMFSISKNACEKYNYKPNPVGKDDNHWGFLYKEVAFSFVTLDK